MIRSGLTLFFLIALSTSIPADELEIRRMSTVETGHELEEFAAAWEIVSVKPEGATKEARRLVFAQNGTYVALDKESKELWGGTFELDPSASPKIWDHRSHEAQKKNGDVLGIYKIEGDKLTACCVAGEWQGKRWKGKPRPHEFKLEDADVLLELRRVQPREK